MTAPRAAVLVLCGIACAGCAKQRPPAPAAPAPAPPLQAWPRGHTPPAKITDSLVLEIPLEYQRAAIQREAPLRPMFPTATGHTEVQFDFFLPNFSGYTLQNYRNESDPNKVEVVYLHEGNPHEAEPDAPGEYPPNMLKRALGELLNPDDHRELYGLKCYAERARPDHFACYGQRDAARHEDIMLFTQLAPYPAEVTFPQLQARYFSRRYGGVRIAWRTHAGNLPRWREIDTHIWQFIEAWNVAAPPATGTPPAAAPRSVPPAAPPPAKPSRS